MPHKITVQYYAILREIRGVDREVILTKAATPSQLYEELAKDHDFSLPRSLLKVAVNEAFVGWDTPLAEGDRVVFIPPVSGG